MAEEIEILISADGKTVTVEGQRIEGPDCKVLTKEIEAALGTTMRQTLKPEYHRAATRTRKVGA